VEVEVEVIVLVVVVPVVPVLLLFDTLQTKKFLEKILMF